MEEQLIEFETAILAKGKGFDINTPFQWLEDSEIIKKITKSTPTLRKDTYSLVEGVYLAPTQSLLQKWLRDKHEVYITPIMETYSGEHSVKVDSEYKKPKKYICIGSYEQALEKGLYEALKLIENE